MSLYQVHTNYNVIFALDLEAGATLKRNAYNEIYSNKSLSVYICLTTA